MDPLLVPVVFQGLLCKSVPPHLDLWIKKMGAGVKREAGRGSFWRLAISLLAGFSLYLPHLSSLLFLFIIID